MTNATTETLTAPTYIVSVDTLDTILDRADLDALSLEHGSYRRAVQHAVNEIADAVEADLEAHGLEGDVERLYEMTTRRDSDDADPQVWDRVLIHGASATREQIGV